MSRNKKHPSPYAGSSVTIHLPPEFVIALDNYVVGLGLEGRAAGILLLCQAGMSALPLDAAVGQVLRQAVASLKRTEFEALMLHFQQRKDILEEVLR